MSFQVTALYEYMKNYIRSLHQENDTKYDQTVEHHIYNNKMERKNIMNSINLNEIEKRFTDVQKFIEYEKK